MSDAQKIATMLLRNSFYPRSAFIPRLSDEAAAMISPNLFQTGRFRGHKPAQRRKHLRQARLQELQELRGEMRIRHSAEMLSIA